MNIPAWPKKHKWLMLLITLLVIILCALAYDAVSYRFDKQAWDRTSESIDSIYSDVGAKYGQPDDHLARKSCGAATGPYGESSDILCEMSVSFIYPASDIFTADKLIANIRNLLNTRSDLQKDKSPHVSSFQDESDGGPTIDYYKTNKGIKCQALYIYDPSFNTQMNLRKPSNQKQFYVSLSCVGSARGKYY